MPAGDLVTGPWQFELNALLLGDGTPYDIDRRGGVRGLVGSSIDMPETRYAHADGSFLADATEGPRTATFSIEIAGTDEDDAGTKYIALRTAWAKSSTDLPLYFNLPGWGKRYVNGRPVGLTEDLSTADFGLIPVLASFRISDPTIYTP
jgi:hypothetical protein